MPSLDRRAFLASAAAAAAGAVAGCGDSDPVQELAAYRSYGYGSRNRGTTLGATGPGDGVEAAWRLGDAAFPQTPAVVDGRVFAATDRSEGSVVVGLDAGSGEELWTYDAGAPLPHWRPAVEDGVLYFVDTQGTAHAVATDDGSEVWQRSLPRDSPASGGLVVSDGAVVFGLGRLDLFRFGGLYALETDDGTTRWHRQPGDGNSHTPAYPAAADGTVYYAAFPAGGRGEAAAVTAASTADGEVEWTATVDREAVYTGVAVTDDRVYAGGPQGSLALDRGDREPVWRSPGGSFFSPPAVADGQVYVSSTGEPGPGVRALDREGGEDWTHAVGTAATPGPATVADGVLYYGASDGRLYALDAASGDRRWRSGEELTGFWTPAVLDDTVYVASGRGLVALR